MQRLFGANKMDDKSYNECMKRIKNLILFFKTHTLANIYVYIILNIDNDQCEVSIWMQWMWLWYARLWAMRTGWKLYRCCRMEKSAGINFWKDLKLAYSQQRYKHQCCFVRDCILQILFSSYLISLSFNQLFATKIKSISISSPCHFYFMLYYFI